MSGVAAAARGKFADLTRIRFLYEICAFLPLLGLLAAFCPIPAHRTPYR